MHVHKVSRMAIYNVISTSFAETKELLTSSCTLLHCNCDVTGQGAAHDRLQAAQLLALDVDQMCVLARGVAATSAAASFAAAVDSFNAPCR